MTKLTEEIKKSIESINQPEVVEAMKVLKKYNLGVSLPHIHKEDEVDILPDDMVQFEKNGVVSFVKRSELDTKESFPVGWTILENTQANAVLGGTNNVVANAWCCDIIEKKGSFKKSFTIQTTNWCCD